MPTHAENVLAAIEAVLENRITTDVEAYQIAGRQITKIPILELIEIRDKYRSERNAELNAISIAAGNGNAKKIKVRFV